MATSDTSTVPILSKETKVHYYKSPTSAKMVPIPVDLIQGMLSHSKSYNLNIMQTSLFNFKNTDQINLKKCLIDVNPLCKVNEWDWEEIKKDTIFKDFRGSSAPHIVLVEGRPGSGKTSFTRKQAFIWSTDFMSCHNKGPSIECKGHDWILMVYVSADSMRKSPMREIIRDALKCKEKNKDVLLTYILDDGAGILVGFDATDEIHDNELRRELESFSRQCYEGKKTPGKESLKILMTARTGLSLIGENAVDRFLSLDGFTIQQGVQYFKMYLENIHGTQDPEALGYVREYQGRLEAVLRNPLMTHIFSELVACNKLPLDELLTRSPIQLLRCLEHHVIRRDAPGSNPATEKYCQKMYRLCLQCLVQGIRQIPESMLKNFSVPTDSPYLGFMNRHPSVDAEPYYTFVHEVIFEYFAAAGLVFYLDDASIPTTTKKAIILSFSADPMMRTTLEMTCGFIAHYKEDLECYITSIVRANIILQHPKNNCSITETTNDLFLLPSIIQDVVKNDVLTTKFGEEQSRVVLEVWQKVQDAFELNADVLKEAGWFTSLHGQNDLPNMHVDLGDSITNIVQTIKEGMTPEQLHFLWRNLRHNVLSPSAFLEENLQKVVQTFKAMIETMRGSDAAEQILKNLTQDSPAELKIESIRIMIEGFRAVPSSELKDKLRPLHDYLDNWFSRNIREHVSPLLEHVVRCLHKSTDYDRKQRLYKETLNCLLPSYGNIGGNIVSIFPVFDVRWALLWEEENNPHLYAATPGDMVKALEQYKIEPRQTTTFAILQFDVSRGWWGDVPIGWTKESVEASLKQLHARYGHIKTLEIHSHKDRVVHDVMDCLQGSDSMIPLPGVMFFSSGTMKLENLRQWIENCTKVPMMIVLYNIRIIIPKRMSMDEVNQELCQRIHGLIIDPMYIVED